MVSKESPEPVAGEFRNNFRRAEFWVALAGCPYQIWPNACRLVDVRFFVTALLIQKDTGGNLAELLDELARVIRERFRIHREVRIKTAQGRLTAMILIALPVGMLLMMRIVNPSYVNVLFDDPIGPKLLAGAAVMQVIGAADPLEDRAYRSLNGGGGEMLSALTAVTFLATVLILLALVYAFSPGESRVAARLEQLKQPDRSRARREILGKTEGAGARPARKCREPAAGGRRSASQPFADHDDESRLSQPRKPLSRSGA